MQLSQKRLWDPVCPTCAQRGGRNAEEEAWQQRLREECSSDLEDWKLDESYADDPR